MPAAYVPWLPPLRVTVEGILRSSTYSQVLVRAADGIPRAFLLAYVHPYASDSRSLRIQRLVWPDELPTQAEVEDALWRCTAAAMSFKAEWLEVEVLAPGTPTVSPHSLNLFGVAHESRAYELYSGAGMEPCEKAAYYAADTDVLGNLAGADAADPEDARDALEIYDEAWRGYASKNVSDEAHGPLPSLAARALGLVAPFLSSDECVRAWRAGDRTVVTYCVPEIVQGAAPSRRLERGRAGRLLRLLSLGEAATLTEIRLVMAALAQELLRVEPSIPLLHVGPIADRDEALSESLVQLGLRPAGSLVLLRRKVGTE
jgi:hypothetical protein